MKDVLRRVRECSIDRRMVLTILLLGIAFGTLVVAGSNTIEYQFDDGNLDDWSGDVDEWAVNTDAPVRTGEYSAKGSGAGNEIYGSDTGIHPSQGDEFGAHTYIDDDTGRFLFGVQDSDNYYFVQWGTTFDYLRLFKVENGSSEQITDQTDVTYDEGQWHEIYVDWSVDGTISIEVIDESDTTVATISANDNTFETGGIGLGSAGGSTTVFDDVFWDSSTELNNPTPTEGQHDSPVSLSVDVSSVGDSEETTVEFYDAADDTLIGSDTVTGEQTASVDWEYNDSRLAAWYAVSVSNGVDLDQTDTVIINTQDPSVKDASPSTGETVQETPVELTIDVDDPDFATEQGDEVAVTFLDGDGDEIGTDSLTSNGTATVEYDDPVGGTNEWSVVAEDSYGNEVESDTFTFASPDELRIYNESDPSSLVDDVDADIEFYIGGGDDAEIVSRSTSDGTIDMEGLPVGEPFVVVAEADGYLPRRIFVEDLTETQSVYMLPEDEDFVEPIFELEDVTGDFSTADSVLVVERSIGGEWGTVQGDYFGASGQWTAQLERNQRHQLTVINTRTGDSRYVGSFTPTASAIQTIRITSEGERVFDEDDARVSYQPSVRSLEAVEDASVSATLDERDDEIEEWTMSVRFTDGSTEQTLGSETRSGPEGGTIEQSIDLTDRDSGQVRVEVEFTTIDGEEVTEVAEFTVREAFDNDLALIPVLVDLPDSHLTTPNADSMTTFIAVIITIMITTAVASKVTASTEISGMVAVVSLVGFNQIGWVETDIVFASAVAFVAFAGLRRGL